MSVRSITNLCPIQAALLKERVILVNKVDDIVGSATKEDAHRMENITGKEGGMLHRAFSLFLFNSKNELLMQRRSSEKITFPDQYTNSCCSHPLYTIPLEQDPTVGIKSAAIRRIKDELGVVDIEPGDITFMTRIIYYGASSGSWGEHELDHVLIVKKDVPIVPNTNEVRETRYMSQSELYQSLENEEEFPITPWFRIIAGSLLKKWWNGIDNLDSLADSTIHEFSFPPQSK